MAILVGDSKSAVHRHHQARARRNQHPESYLWETPEGRAWLNRLFVAALYWLGVKNNMGADQLSCFFEFLNLEQHLGISPSTLRKVLKVIEAKLPEFQAEQEKRMAQETRDGIIAGDETFFCDMMLLVAIELSSGYIVLETPAVDRTFTTWKDKLKPRLSALKIHAKHFIADRAGALIKLATEGLNCASGADLFHVQYDLSRWLPAALGRKKKQADEALERASNILKESPDDGAKEAQKQIVTQAEQQVEKFEQAHKKYRIHQQNISQAVHPFHIEENRINSKKRVAQTLTNEVNEIEKLAKDLNIWDKNKVVEKVRKQIGDLSCHVSVWWFWLFSLLEDTPRETKRWVLLKLLPVTYWHRQYQKATQPHMREKYHLAWERTRDALQKAPLPAGMGEAERQHWQTWCDDKVKHFQRASSAVEGRNGWLSQVYHNGRGFSEKRLIAQGVIHNYGIKREDSTTAANRLFKQDHPDLFEWLLEQIDVIPVPRKRRVKKVANSLIG